MERWRKKSIKEQPKHLLEYNLKVGKMDKETESFIRKELKRKRR